MSMQRFAIMSAVGAHGGSRNKTIYLDYHNSTSNGGFDIHKDFNLIVGSAILSLVFLLICFMCYCFNRSINKSSMALYRQHFIRSINEHNVDIYTVEQFFEAETYVPLCIESQPQPHGQPPSYDAIMALEHKINGKKCCLHSCKLINNEDGGDGVASDVINESKPFHGSCEPSESVASTARSDDSAPNDVFRAEKYAGCVEDTESGANQPSTSAGQAMSADDKESETPKCTCTCNLHHSRTPSEEIDILNDNGILRMDMSKIIDQTGLPTYDAALKLESYGYV